MKKNEVTAKDRLYVVVELVGDSQRTPEHYKNQGHDGFVFRTRILAEREKAALRRAWPGRRFSLVPYVPANRKKHQL